MSPALLQPPVKRQLCHQPSRVPIFTIHIKMPYTSVPTDAYKWRISVNNATPRNWDRNVPCFLREGSKLLIPSNLVTQPCLEPFTDLMSSSEPYKTYILDGIKCCGCGMWSFCCLLFWECLWSVEFPHIPRLCLVFEMFIKLYFFKFYNDFNDILLALDGLKISLVGKYCADISLKKRILIKIFQKYCGLITTRYARQNETISSQGN